MSDAVQNPQTRNQYIPGEVGIWVFVLGDMMIFALFFCVFVWYRADDPVLYAESQALLNQNYGAINTVLLLLSSWFVVMALTGARQGMGVVVPRLFAGAWLCGFGFAVLKVIEYSEKVGQGLTLTTNDFFMYYYIFTGIHALHLLIGLGVLTYLIIRSHGGGRGPSDISVFESGATFWHMVDLLWIVLFPLIYLV